MKKKDYARLDYYDAWLPELAPSQKSVSWALAKPWTDERWQRFKKSYLKEMKAPDAQRLIELLARLSHHADFSLGCYCEDESHCHRSTLRSLLAERFNTTPALIFGTIDSREPVFDPAGEGQRAEQAVASQQGVAGTGANAQQLQRVFGEGRSMEMVLTGDMIDAQTAEKIGLVNHVYPAAELEAKTMELADKIAALQSQTTSNATTPAQYAALDPYRCSP